MMTMDNSQYGKLIEDIRSYLSRRYDLFLVRLLEKVSIIVGLIITLVVVLFLTSIVVVFGGIALAYVLGQWLPMWAAYLIIGGVFLLLLVLAVVFRRQWFVNPIVAILSGVLFGGGSTDSSSDTPAERKEADHD